jgi:carbonic anhydrase/acetyltransferase-like protein (isoleucine patch superfamily)
VTSASTANAPAAQSKGEGMLRGSFQRLLSKIAFIAPGGSSLRPWLHRMRGVKIGKNVWISQYVYIDELHPEAVTIGDNCSIGLRASIFAHFYWGGKRGAEAAGEVVIEHDVFVGPHCVVLPNVHIGHGAVVKAGTAVTGNVPPETFWGQPSPEPLARVLVPLTPAHSYEEFRNGLRPIRRRRDTRRA